MSEYNAKQMVNRLHAASSQITEALAYTKEVVMREVIPSFKHKELDSYCNALERIAKDIRSLSLDQRRKSKQKVYGLRMNVEQYTKLCEILKESHFPGTFITYINPITFQWGHLLGETDDISPHVPGDIESFVSNIAAQLNVRVEYYDVDF